jgi:hypothetical protein
MKRRRRLLMGDYEHELERMFHSYVEPLAKKKSLPIDEWETMIARSDLSHIPPALKVALLGHIIRRHKTQVFFPRVARKYDVFVDRETGRVTRLVSEILEKGKKVPLKLKVQRDNLKRLEKLQFALPLGYVKKILRLKHPVKVVLNKKGKEVFVVRKKKYSKSAFWKKKFKR